MKKQLTDLQRSVYVFMREFFAENDQLPTVAVICEKFGKYPNQIHELQLALMKHGLIERNAVHKFKFARVAV